MNATDTSINLDQLAENISIRLTPEDSSVEEDAMITTQIRAWLDTIPFEDLAKDPWDLASDFCQANP